MTPVAQRITKTIQMIVTTKFKIEAKILNTKIIFECFFVAFKYTNEQMKAGSARGNPKPAAINIERTKFVIDHGK